jgi:hypothetical protein
MPDSKKLVQCYICGKQIDAYKSYNIHYDYPPRSCRRRIRWVSDECLSKVVMPKVLNVEIVDMRSGEIIRDDYTGHITPSGMDTLPDSEKGNMHPEPQTTTWKDGLRRLNIVEMYSLGFSDRVVIRLYYDGCTESRQLIVEDKDKRAKKLSRVVRDANRDGKATLEPWCGGGVGWRADRA